MSLVPVSIRSLREDARKFFSFCGRLVVNAVSELGRERGLWSDQTRQASISPD